VIGVSTDSVDVQKQFAQKEGLNFPLLADVDKALSKRFGVLNMQGGYANRVTFVIDKQGNIAKVFTKVADVNKHPEEVLKFVEEKLGKN
jgi:thioredoxin-dependent peroxiredoxin